MIKTKQTVQTLFDEISSRYDLFNTTSTFFLDHHWRRCASRLVEKSEARILDVCTGTGELALQFSKRLHGKGRVVGVDFSGKMLQYAQKKVRRSGKEGEIPLLLGDAQHLSFSENTFDYVTSGFSMRNLIDLDRGLQEMHRVLKPGGKAVILEINRPTNRISGFFYRLHLRVIVPLIGFLTVGKLYPFLYLRDTVLSFQSPKEFCERLRKAGFQEVSFRVFLPGAISLYCATK